MRIGLEIEQIRQELGLSVVFMCNAMDLTTGEYPSLLYPATPQRKVGK